MTLSSIVTSTFIKYAFEKALKGVTRFVKEKDLKIVTGDKEVETAISNHINQVSNWSNEVNLKDLSKAKNLSEIFIDVDIFLMPSKSKLDDENIDKISSRTLLDISQKHIVILGQPGAGKTTLMKSICQSIFIDSNYVPQFKIPLLVKLRDLNSKSYDKSPIINLLSETVGLVVNSKTETKPDDILLIKQQILLSLLDEFKAIIILDGYDEISDLKLQERVIEDFKILTLTLNNSKAILTSRSSDFNYSLENVEVLEICPLNATQIRDFANHWLKAEDKIADFLIELKNSPFIDTAIRPLTLAHLCAIFERSGRIPEKPKTVYKKVVNLLLEEWDEQRGVRRVSGYSHFEVDRKIEFLSRLSYQLSVEYKTSIFSDKDLREIYNDICYDYGLNKKDVRNVITEIETHTGLIIQSGYKQYEFAHKSIQEYLCSEHMVKLPSIPKFAILALLPNELAIAVTISSNPSDYFCELVLNHFVSNLAYTYSEFRRDEWRKRRRLTGGEPYNKEAKSQFITIFINRLVLEKPDFNNSELVGLAIIVLYTLYKETETTQLGLFNPLLPVQFEQFISLAFARNAKFKISRYYDISEAEVDIDDKAIRLRKKSDIDTDLGYTLPSYVYVKKMFVSDIEFSK